ncbi:MAG: hypothetical protein KF832_31735 [Caldilineaceae bacterium]|nr:hypothetical protein [Caldilineaceae bacterium]
MIGDYAIATLGKMFTEGGAHRLVGNPRVLGWRLGRPPTSLASFLQRVMAAR